MDATDAGRLFEEYSERIYGYCLRFLRSPSEAEDAVQTTFLYAHRALQRGVVPEAEYPWLHSIAKNVCRWQRRTIARRGPLSSDVDLDALPAATRDNGDDKELLRELDDALASIPEGQRRALVLREWHGLSSAEIASRLGLSSTATYALLTRARRSLAQAMTATSRRPLLGLDFGTLLLKLKGLLAGGAAKAAVTAVAVGSVAAGGVAVERAVGKPEAEMPAPVVTSPGRASEKTARTDPTLRPAQQTTTARTTRAPERGAAARERAAGIAPAMPAVTTTLPVPSDSVERPGSAADPEPDPGANPASEEPITGTRPSEGEQPSAAPDPGPVEQVPVEPLPLPPAGIEPPSLPVPDVEPPPVVDEVVPELPKPPPLDAGDVLGDAVPDVPPVPPLPDVELPALPSLPSP